VQEGLDRAWQGANEAVEQIERWCSDVPDERSSGFSRRAVICADGDLATGNIVRNVDGLHDALQEALEANRRSRKTLDQHCDTAAKEIEITRARYIESAAALTQQT